LQNVEIEIYTQNKPIINFDSRQATLCLDAIRNAVRSFFAIPENMTEYLQWVASGEKANWANAQIAVDKPSTAKQPCAACGGGNGDGLAHAVPRCPNKPPTRDKRGHLTMSNAPYSTFNKNKRKGDLHYGL
jgi:hypothetical protein